MPPDPRPLVLHVVHRFDMGGLENGLVNLINHMPVEAYRHAVLALTEVTDFRLRVQRPGVEFVALRKAPGQGLWVYPRFLQTLHRLQPAVLHTRNLGTLEFQLPGAWARVPARVHGEHGRDIDDLDGSSRRHRWLRHAYRPFVHQHVALSRDLHGYLTATIGVAEARVTQIYNGVDASRFAPSASGLRQPLTDSPFNDPALWVVGTVGRMQAVKAQTALALAFVRAVQQQPALQQRLRLVMVGEGPLRAESTAVLAAAGLGHLAWLPGARSDMPEVMRALDGFVLPSLAEGVSNTILESMASGLPVIATDVGANPELVQAGVSGDLVPVGNTQALADAITRQAVDPERARAQGRAGRAAAVARFSMEAMAGSYRSLYDRLLGRAVEPPQA